MHIRPQRGLTFVTVLIILGAVLGIGWIVTYGPVYWDNTEVNRALKEAGNLAYRTPDDEKVRDFILNALHQKFSTGERDVNGEEIMLIDVQRDDIRIERTDSPKWVHIWLSYTRTVRIPLLGEERQVVFNDHVEQDLSPVKW